MTPLDLVLAPIRSAIIDLRRQLVAVRSATVTSIDPVRIQLDGETAPVSASPATLVPVGPGDRIRVLHYGTTHLIFGRVNRRGLTRSLRRSADGNIPDSSTVALTTAWASASGDPGNLPGGINLANSVLTVPSDGDYLVEISLVFAQSTGEGYRHVYLTIDDEIVKESRLYGRRADSVPLTAIRTLQAGARLGVSVRQTTGETVTLTAGTTGRFTSWSVSRID